MFMVSCNNICIHAAILNAPVFAKKDKEEIIFVGSLLQNCSLFVLDALGIYFWISLLIYNIFLP